MKIKVASVSRNKLVPAIRLKSADEIEKYTEMIKSHFLKSLKITISYRLFSGQLTVVRFYIITPITNHCALITVH